MIRICYENFAVGTHDVAGLHGRAERCARGITLYLLPGLTSGQREAVIRRLRQEASRGFGPPLSLPQLAIALCLDRVRTAARMAGAVVRLHPAVTLLPGAFMVAVMALFVISAQAGPAPTAAVRAAAGTRVKAARLGAWYTYPSAMAGPSRIVPATASLPVGARRASCRRIPPTCRVPRI